MRTSLCGPDVPAEDLPVKDVPAVEDVLDGDVPVEDIRTLCPFKDVPDMDVPGKDIISARGRPCADVLVEDICVRFYFCPFVQS